MALMTYLYIATAFFVADPLYVCGVLFVVIALTLIAVFTRDRARLRRADVPPGAVFIPGQRSVVPKPHGPTGRAN